MIDNLRQIIELFNSPALKKLYPTALNNPSLQARVRPSHRQIQSHTKASPLAYTRAMGFLALLICLSCAACKDDKSKANQAQSGPKEAIIPAAEQQVEQQADQQVILFYGNSLTAGYGLEEDQSFPSLIEDRIDSLGLKYKVVNAGLSGETTSGGLKRIDWVMKQQVDIFFLELGANDMLRGLPIEETRKNLSAIIQAVKDKNPSVKIALCEMMAAPNMGDAYVVEFTQIYKDLAAPSDISFVPFFLEGVAGQPEFLLKDGKHPNAQGQRIVAENIWQSLKKLL